MSTATISVEVRQYVWFGKRGRCLARPANHFFKALGISDTKESDIESRVHSTKFTMVALVWQQFVHHHCWWAIWPRGYHKPSVSVLLLVLQHWGSPQYWMYFYLFISGKRRFNTSVIVNATWVLAEFGFRSFWLLLYVLAAPIASFLVSLSFLFFETQGLRWPGGVRLRSLVNT